MTLAVLFAVGLVVAGGLVAKSVEETLSVLRTTGAKHRDPRERAMAQRERERRRREAEASRRRAA
jgi:hypothetical protein